MAEFAKAAESQLELHRWLLGAKGQLWLRHWIMGEKQAEPAKGDMYQTLAYAEPQKLLSADSIWVDDEMSDLVSVAREDFKPEPFLNEDLLVHTGFVYFDKPVFMLDRNKQKLSIGAFSWCPLRVTNRSPEDIHSEVRENWQHEQEGSEVVIYGVEESQPDIAGIALTLFTSTVEPEDSYHRSMQGVRAEYQAPDLLPLHFTPVFFGSGLDDGDMYDEQGRYTGADEWWRTVQTCLRLMQQRIVTQEDAVLPRATRRRWERAGYTPPRDVCVIRLRRARPKGHADEDVESGRKLTHRHFREGHWRNQWYPSLQAHRQIRIQRTIVGDDSLPLIIKRRFYKWDR
jgi:hypothetical protein